MYEGDSVFYVNKNKENKDWEIYICNGDKGSGIFTKNSASIFCPDQHKVFKYKKNALDWIEAQNPKETIIDLKHKLSLEAKCSKESVSILYRGGLGAPIIFSKENIETIYKAMQELD